jgi:hypothetical protein
LLLPHLLKVDVVPRDQNQHREIAREADGRRPTDALARARDDGD